MSARRTLAPLALAALGAIALAGCGGSKSSSSPAASTFATPGTAAKHTVPPGEVVAYVSGTPILKSSYAHWLSVENAMGGANNASHRALGFLITSSWVLGEAQARHVAVPESEVSKRLEALLHQSFPKAGQLSKFLAKSHETKGDLLARVKVELLTARIAAQVTAGKSSEAQRKATLTSFERRFQAHWRSVTDCLPVYVMEDCKQYKGRRERLSSPPASSSTASKGSSSGSASSGSASSGSASSGSASSNVNGEVYTPPGAFSLSSSAFERNGAVPAEYTCDGKGISPPLQWEKVPAKASELVLFVIDDNAAGSNGGIRWVVGGIDPSSHGVAAGQVPPGGIVGTNTAGKAAYGPICPDHGHTDTIELVMYALRKDIALSPGFSPTLAEHEYGSTKDILGSAAITYAVYHRA
jgi:phosphatidylethanolamine-binding protein (PEBP) family uncharacterized protein